MNSTPVSPDFTIPVAAIMGILVGLAILVFFIIALVKACKKKTRGWILTCIATGLLGFGILFGSAVVASMKLIDVFAQLDKVEVTLTTKDGRFAIKVPKSWQILPEINAQASIGAGHLIREQYLMVIVEEKGDAKVDLQSYAKLVLDSMSAKQVKPIVGETKPIQIDGHPALRARMDGIVDKLKITYHCTFVETPDCVVQILFWTLSDRVATGFPVFDKLAATFTEVGVPQKTASAAPPKPDLSDTTPAGRVRAILVDQFGVESPKLVATARLKEDLAADELDLVEVVMAVEEEFHLDISDAVAASWKSVGDIIRHVETSAATSAAK